MYAIRSYYVTADGFFKDYSDPGKVNDFNWPDPKKYVDINEALRLVNEAPKDKVIMGVCWSSHFQDVITSYSIHYTKLYDI